MIALEVADLVVIASRTLDLDTDTALDLLDVDAADAALVGARAVADPDDVAGQAAGLLHALIRHQPFRRGNDQVALVATLQFVALNGGQADLGSPEATREVLTALRAGRLDRAELTEWLAPRVRTNGHGGSDTSPSKDDQASREDRASRAKEEIVARFLGGRGRRPRSRPGLFTRFTDRARSSVTLAMEEARLLNHNYVGTEHLLLGLLHETGGVGARALASLGISQEAVRAEVERIIGRGAGAPAGHVPFTPRSKKVLELALREAVQLGHNYIGTEHILLALVREGEGVAAQVLVKHGADLPDVRERVLQLLEEVTPEPAPAPVPPILVQIDARIDEVRSDKDTAIDNEDWERAADLRRAEVVMLQERAEKERAWLVGEDTRLSEENQRLQGEVDRLRDLLRRHGIDPDNGASQTA